MLVEKINNKKSFYIVLVLTLLTLLFNNYICMEFFLVFGIFSWFLVYKVNKKDHSIEYVFFKMIIYSIPLSFTDVFGRFYGESYLSWFNLFLLFIILTYIYKYFLVDTPKFNKLSITSLILVTVGIIPVLVSNDIIEGLKQYININVLFILIIVGNSFKINLTKKDKNELKTDYIFATIIVGIGVIVQIISINYFDIIIGHHKLWAGYREAFGFLFTDYSFLSLYLVSGALMMYSVEIIDNKSNAKLKWIAIMFFLLFASLMTSARTGIFAFILVYGFYSFFSVFHLLEKGSRDNVLKSIIIIISNISILIISYLLIIKTRTTVKLGDSGRSLINIQAFDIFKNNLWFGIGFGSSNYIGTIPHNIFFQFIAQGGLLYIIPLMIFIQIFIYTGLKNDFDLLLVILCVLIGSLFIPNIFNSRFFPVLALLLSINVSDN